MDSNWLAGPLDTGYIDLNMAQLVADPLPLEQALAAVWILAGRENDRGSAQGLPRDFRVNLDTGESLRLGHGRDVHTLRIHTGPETWTLQLPAAGWPEGWRAKSEHMRSGVAEWVFQLIDHQANAIDAQPLYSNRSSRHGK